MVCLEDRDDVLGSAWLHQPRTVPHPDAMEEKDENTKNLLDCAVSACVACLKTYFTVRRNEKITNTNSQKLSGVHGFDGKQLLLEYSYYFFGQEDLGTTLLCPTSPPLSL